jgi:hypothetical protein
MPTAQGFIKSVGGGDKFMSTFVIDGIQYHLSGSFNPAVQPFESNQASLEFDSVEQLTAVRNFEGKVGTQDVQVNLANGAHIKGYLNMPISPASRVSGAGSWIQD